MNRVQLRLAPLAMNRTVTGPQVRMDQGEAVVTYDFEHDDGSIEWAEVAFRGAAVTQFKTTPLCTATDLDAYSHILEYEDSEWAAKLLTERQATEPLHRLYHYRMFFDDAGCLDVLASTIETRTLADGPAAYPHRRPSTEHG